MTRPRCSTVATAVATVMVVASCACGGDPKVTKRQAEPAEVEREQPVALPAQLVGPEVHLTTVDGREVKLDDYRGKVTVVSMWATFCPACNRELPLVEALHRHFDHRDDVRVLMVSIDEIEEGEFGKVRSLIDANGITAPVLIDAKRDLFPKLAPRDDQGELHFSVPLLAVIDEEFRLRRKVGPVAETAEGFIEDIEPLVTAALSNEEPPPLQPYQPALGSSFSRKQITLTAEGLTAHQRVHYLDDLRHQLRAKYPELSNRQFEELMNEVGKGLRSGGTFTVTVPG